jgi:hypothetical protein
VIQGVTPDEIADIEQGCALAAGHAGSFTLYQLIHDEAGTMALVYSDEYVLSCAVDGPSMKYNPSYGGVQGFTPPITVDNAGAIAGGDTPYGKPEYVDQRGVEEVAGRISPEVTRVTYVQGADSVDAVLANGTFVARIVHPTTWQIPENRPAPIVRAYDANGTLVAEVGP